LQSALGGAYTLERELGGGGMARVFVAEETALRRRVVLKVLAPELAEAVSPGRFRREVALAARLQHPNIVPLLAAGDGGGMPFYTMPFVPGESLRHRLAARGPLPVREAVAVLRDVARALAHAHSEGVVHRDVKPENVLLYAPASGTDVDATAVVTDFGIAKALAAARAHAGPEPAGETITQIGMALGTPAYMAPEQALADAVDHRADVYAFGVLAYELFAGATPFAGRSAQQLVVAHLVEAPAPLAARAPAVPPALAAVVMRCLAKEPGDRPQQMTEVLRLLEAPAATAESAGGDARAEAGAARTPSVALLPFVNLSADPENEYFSDGITEEILSVLAQDRALRVAARSSSFAFKGQAADLRVIAERLQVASVLEGTVRRAGNRVRITAQLVSAADGVHLWSGRFDRELTDIFAVQDEIAQAIAVTLRRTLLGGTDVATPGPAREPAARGGAPSAIRPPASVEAYDAYLKGRHANHRRADGMHEARAHFERALALDPDFAPAHAGLALSYVWLGMYLALPPAEALPRTRRHAEHALALAPDLADAHYLLGYVSYMYDWDEAACERHVERALALEPRHTDALTLAAAFYLMRGRRSDALAATATALQSDPLGVGSRTGALIHHFLAEEYRWVIAEGGRLVAEGHGDHSEVRRWRGRAAFMVGDLALARSDLEAAAVLTQRNPWVLVDLANMYSLEGRLDDARQLRDELLERSEREWVPALPLGHMYRALGDYDAAFRWYDRAYRAREFLCVMLHVDPELRLVPPGRSEPITDDPRFADLVRRVGMAP
jgi:serine/threonine-protein kinase